MAPPVAPQAATSEEHNAFIEKLRAYHEKRGTTFEPEPRVGTKQIDLLALYKAVIDRGGYDKVSDEKLAWRKLGAEFLAGTNHLPALAFQLKSVYYKQLAAYEISTIYNKEPPPREILEDTTAKGGGLLTRTVENYRPSTRRETGALGNPESDASGDDGTPVRDRGGSEETPGSGGRVTRGLRQAPPQRVLFQPDTQSSRQTRNVSATSHAPSQQLSNQQQAPRGASSFHNPSSNMEQSPVVANYEPRPQMPLTLRPVITQGNAPAEYARRDALLKNNLNPPKPGTVPPGVILPGRHYDGPNIYIRCLLALKSGVKSETDYALHHLVKITMERGDKYRFEGFPGLAEALVEKIIEVGSLFYLVDWEVSYYEDGPTAPNVLNGVDGTPDILERIAKLIKLDIHDSIQTEEFSDAILQVTEAGLALRNMVMLEENAEYVSSMSPLRDMLSIVLNLPDRETTVELKQYALDIAEQITKYLHFEPNDPLYISLLAQLKGSDRGAILTALHAISRISMNLEENNLLQGVPPAVLQNIIDWTLLDDDDLVSASLDFLYQFTAVIGNVDYLLSKFSTEPLVNQLVRLLSHGMKQYQLNVGEGSSYKLPAPATIAPFPAEMFAQVVKVEEPERSSLWLRSLFEEDDKESITQIALWQAYQACFSHAGAQGGTPLLPAADFIKNVSTTFGDKVAAQVQTEPVQKFIIKGIRMRHVPVDAKGIPFNKCLWVHQSIAGATCGQFFMAPEEMYKHILLAHMGATMSDDGKFNNITDRHFSCLWNGCTRFNHESAPSLAVIAKHIKLHLPKPHQENQDLGPSTSKKPKRSYVVTQPKKVVSLWYTVQDERGDAAGIPLSAVLVLRNLARNIPKTATEADNMNVPNGVSWVEILFRPVVPRIAQIMSHNKVLANYTSDLLAAIKNNENEDD